MISGKTLWRRLAPFVLLPVILAAPALAADKGVWEDEQAAKDIAKYVAPLPQLPLKETDLALPPELAKRMGMVSTIAVDPKSQVIYLLQRGTGADPIIAVDRTGHVLRSWGKDLYVTPHGIRVDPEGNVWTTDATSSTILKFSPEGKKLLEIDVGGQPSKAKFNGTTDVAFGPDGHVFVSDGYDNARVIEYTADGKRVKEWGAHGGGQGQFNVPHGIAIDKDNIVYVADRENGRVQKFDLAGRYLGEWDGLGKPMNITLLDDGTVLVACGYHNPRGVSPDWIAWVVKLDRKTGKPLGYLAVGDDAHAQSALGDGTILTGGDTNNVTAVHMFTPAR